MDIGLVSSTANIDDLVGDVQKANTDGFSHLFMPQIFSLDALTALAIAGREVPGIKLGTAVVPTYRQIPMMLAQQALTVSQIIGDRLVLGIGLSHQVVVEGMWGLSYDKPLRHMREYLDSLMPLLAGEQVSSEGETITTRGGLQLQGPNPEVLLAALGPKMLELAGRVADGTSLWMVGPSTIASHILPVIAGAAEAAGRPAPQINASLPVCVTTDSAKAKANAAKEFAVYGQLPSYRAMLDREGAGGPEDVAIIGSADEVATRVGELAEAGSTLFVAAPYGNPDEQAATRELLVSQIKAS